MARLYAPTRRRECLRSNGNGVPIPATPCQIERVRAAVQRDYEKKPQSLRCRIQDEISTLIFGGEPAWCWSLRAVARQYCREFINGF